MSNLSWYQRHLSVPPPAAPPEAPRFVIVDGRAYPMGGDPGTVPQQQSSAPPWKASPQLGEAPIGQVHVEDGLRLWKGTRDAQTAKSGYCPNCDSPNYMTSIRTSSDGGGRGHVAMAHCFACGYRPDRPDDSGTNGLGERIGGRPKGPSLQEAHAGAVRGIGQGEIPIEAARQAGGNKDAWGRVSGVFGKQGITDHVQ